MSTKHLPNLFGTSKSVPGNWKKKGERKGVKKKKTFRQTLCRMGGKFHHLRRGTDEEKCEWFSHLHMNGGILDRDSVRRRTADERFSLKK